MVPSADSAILEALGLDPASTRISTHGGSGFSSTFKLSSTLNGEKVNYFVKTGTGKDAETMFKGSQPATRVFSQVQSTLRVANADPRQANMPP